MRGGPTHARAGTASAWAALASLALAACFGSDDSGAAGTSAGGSAGGAAGTAGVSGHTVTGTSTGGSSSQISTAGMSGGGSGGIGGDSAGTGSTGRDGDRSAGISDADAQMYCATCNENEGCGYPAPGAAHPECVGCAAVQCELVTCAEGETLEIPPGRCCSVCVPPGSEVASCDGVPQCAGAVCTEGADCCDTDGNYFECSCVGIEGCVLLLHCAVNEPYGCAQVSEGVPVDPNNPPPSVCGCQVECGTQFRIANAAGGTWPNGSLKGVFTCASGPPP